MTQKQIKESLEKQLKLQGKDGAYYMDLVNDYVNYWKQKKALQKDIAEQGVRIEGINGNGFKTSKVNESIKLLQGVTKTMLDILRDLNLREPTVDRTGTNPDDYL